METGCLYAGVGMICNVLKLQLSPLLPSPSSLVAAKPRMVLHSGTGLHTLSWNTNCSVAIVVSRPWTVLENYFYGPVKSCKLVGKVLISRISVYVKLRICESSVFSWEGNIWGCQKTTYAC